MIDFTLTEILTGLDLSDDEIKAELKPGKHDGSKPESEPAPVVAPKFGKGKPQQ